MYLARLGLSAVQNIFGSKNLNSEPENNAIIDPHDISEALALVRNCIELHGLPSGLETDHLRRSVIQCAVDLMQDLLDNDEPWEMVERDPTEPNKLQISQLLMQFAEQFQIFPESLFVTVTLSDRRIQRMGMNSEIYTGQWKGMKVAMRLLRSHTRMFDESDRGQTKVLLACLRWRQLRHPNVVQLFGVDITNIGHAPTLVHPWMEKGNIRDHIKNLTVKPEPECLVSWVCDVARGMDYLHGMGIVHGDLRGNNVLLSDDGDAIVTDVFLYPFLEDWTAPYRCKGGPERWLAPEVLDNSDPSSSSDSFCFGLVCIEIYTGEIHFPDLLDARAIDNMSQGRFPSKPNTMPDQVWALASACWNSIPTQRPTMQQVLTQLSGN
ncbi:hypothetical protein QCA50_016335 [Cerrena zonata]|uniref:Protein kinase domain-containing protein n=1 Tax=Cerrena zonata TaxID=2478898 RepID=A0AAW0FNF8_9APHY